jgi:hypothetical protein
VLSHSGLQRIIWLDESLANKRDDKISPFFLGPKF